MYRFNWNIQFFTNEITNSYRTPTRAQKSTLINLEPLLFQKSNKVFKIFIIKWLPIIIKWSNRVLKIVAHHHKIKVAFNKPHQKIKIVSSKILKFIDQNGIIEYAQPP